MKLKIYSHFLQNLQIKMDKVIEIANKLIPKIIIKESIKHKLFHYEKLCKLENF